MAVQPQLPINISKKIKEIIRFEPLFINLLSLDEEEARILALMFRNSGYMTKDAFFSSLQITRPTLIKKVNSLLKAGYLRQNNEFNPVRLTLTLSTENLYSKLAERKSTQNHAIAFLQETLKIKKKHTLRHLFVRALKVLLGEAKHSDLLAESLTVLYIDKNTEYNLISLPDMISHLRSTGDNHQDKFYEQLFGSHHDLFYLFHQKIPINRTPPVRRPGRKGRPKEKFKKGLYLQSRLPLLSLIKNLITGIKIKNDHFRELIIELEVQLTEHSPDTIPHHMLQYPYDIKLRLKICLRSYSKLRIIDNGIYSKNNPATDLLEMINEITTPEHEVRILTNRINAIPPYLKERVILLPLPDNGVDSSTSEIRLRDIVLMGNDWKMAYGALIFPLEPDFPYYNITPHAMKILSEFFKDKWRT